MGQTNIDQVGRLGSYLMLCKYVTKDPKQRQKCTQNYGNQVDQFCSYLMQLHDVNYVTKRYRKCTKID